MSAAIAIPDWLRAADADERAALASLGIAADVTSEPSTQAARDAQASKLLRAFAMVRAEIAERREAQRMEVEEISRIYERDVAPLERRAVFLESAIEVLARQSDFGNRKSRAIGFGEYGTRSVPPKVEIIDEARVREWAFRERPDVLRGTVTLPHAAFVALTDAAFGEIAREAEWMIERRALNAQVARSVTAIDLARIVSASERPYVKPPRAG